MEWVPLVTDVAVGGAWGLETGSFAAVGDGGACVPSVGASASGRQGETRNRTAAQRATRASTRDGLKRQ